MTAYEDLKWGQTGTIKVSVSISCPSKQPLQTFARRYRGGREGSKGAVHRGKCTDKT